MRTSLGSHKICGQRNGVRKEHMQNFSTPSTFKNNMQPQPKPLKCLLFVLIKLNC